MDVPDADDPLLETGRPWSADAKFAWAEAEKELPADGPYDDARVKYLLTASSLLANKQSFEAGWVGQRMSWLVISQSFLFNAFAAAATQKTVPVLVFVKWLVPMIGFLQATSTQISIVAARRIDGELYKTRSVLDIGLRRFCPGMRQLPPLGNVRIGRAYQTRRLGALSSVVIPISLIAAWTMLLTMLVLLHWRPRYFAWWFDLLPDGTP